MRFVLVYADIILYDYKKLRYQKEEAMLTVKRCVFSCLVLLLGACTSTLLPDYSQDSGKQEIAAGSGLSSDKGEEQNSVDKQEQKAAEKTEKATAASKAETKPKEATAPKEKEAETLADTITLKKEPSKSDEATAIHYMTDEEFIASVEKREASRTIPVMEEELPAPSHKAKNTASKVEKNAQKQELETAVFSPSVSYLLETVYFSNGGASLTQEGQAQIKKVAAKAKKHKDYRIRVLGHASSRTRDTDIASHKLANFKVSQQRAEAVAAALRKTGIPASKISVEALSDSAPAYLEVMPEGERLNRRAEIYISY